MKKNYIFLGLIFILSLVTRIIYMRDMAFHWDSVNFTYGVLNFSVMMHSPQPPGYIGYIFLGKIFHTLIPNPHIALVLLSVVCGALSVPLMYFVLKELFDNTSAVYGSYIFMTGPLLWAYSDVAMSYIPAMAIMLLFVYTALKGKKTKTPVWFYFSAAMYALLGSVRQTDMVFLFPLAVYFLFLCEKKHRIYLSLLAVGLSLLWFIPLIELTGGLKIYFGMLSEQFIHSAWEKSPLFSMNLFSLHTVSKVLFGCFWISPASFIFILWGIIYAVIKRKNIFSKNIMLVLGLWAVPVLMFFIIIHVGEYGYLLILAPVLVISGIMVISRLKPAKFFILLTIGLQILLFTQGNKIIKNDQEDPPDLVQELFSYYSGDGLIYHAKKLSSSYDFIKTHYDPETTMIFISMANSRYDSNRHISYYLPGFVKKTWGIYPLSFKNEPVDKFPKYDGKPIRVTKKIPPGIKKIILWNRALFPLNKSEKNYPVKTLTIPGGKTIQEITVSTPLTLLAGRKFFLLSG